MKAPSPIHERIRKYAFLDTSVLFRDFHITKDGLSREQVQENRRLYGENFLSGHRDDTILFRLRRAFVNPFTTVLLALAVISAVTERLLGPSPARSQTAAPIILSMLLLSGGLRLIQEFKAKSVADRLTKLIDACVEVRRDGHFIPLSTGSLTVGDLVRLRAGDRVPADIRLVETSELFVSQSALTGENGVTEKTAKTLTGVPSDTPSQYENIVFMGSTVAGGTGCGVVLAVGADTAYGDMGQAQRIRKNGFDRGAASIAWVLIRFMAVLVPVVFITCGMTQGNWITAFLFALSVAVGLTPEMLPMVVNACLSRGSSAMRKKETIVKNINAMQGFGSMDVLCVDKTGTLTDDTITLEYYMDILGNEESQVLDYGWLGSFYHTGVANQLDQALLRCSERPEQKAHFEKLSSDHKKLDEIPFDHERRLASVLVAEPESRQSLLIVKGSPEAILGRCRFVSYRGQLAETEGSAEGLHAVVDELTEDGMKVLALAVKPMGEQISCARRDEYDLTLLGYLAFFDAPKKSAASAIAKLQELHVNVRVLTGDQLETAVSVCRRLGLDVSAALTGWQLDRLSEEQLSLRAEQTAVFAELSPRQKTRVVKALQDNGHTVGFLGDGMNDLPAILQADVGISVDSGMEAVLECADVILLKKDLNVLEQGILEGRKAFVNMSKYIRITASSNFGNICSIVAASVLLPFLPMTSVQLLLLNLLYDSLCLALPWDKVDPELYRKPREWSGKTLGRFMCFFGPISSLFDLATFGFLFFFLAPSVCGGDFSSLKSFQEQARFAAVFQTGWFLESMWTQVLILPLLRTAKLPFLESRPAAPVLAVTGLGALLFTALVFTPLGGVMGLVPLPPAYFSFLALAVPSYLLAVTVFKRRFVRKYRELI